MSSSGYAFTSLRDGIDLTRLVNALTAFETTMEIKEPNFRLMIIFVVIASSREALSNSGIKEATGWPLPRIQHFLDQLVEAGLIEQWNEGRSVVSTLTTKGISKAKALTALLNLSTGE